MSKIKILSLMVIGLIIINLAILLFLFFSHSNPAHFADREGPKKIIIKKLHFNGSQVEAYQKLIDEHRANIRRLDTEIRQTKNDLYLTLIDNSTENATILKNRLVDLNTQIDAVHYNHFADIKKLCTAEQIPYFNNLTKELAKLFAPEKNLPPPPKDL